MKECYECGKEVCELSKRSRCVFCEYRRCIVNEKDNERLRCKLYNVQEVLNGGT